MSANKTTPQGSQTAEELSEKVKGWKRRIGSLLPLQPVTSGNQPQRVKQEPLSEQQLDEFMDGVKRQVEQNASFVPPDILHAARITPRPKIDEIADEPLVVDKPKDGGRRY